MAKQTKTCRVCGTTYDACNSVRTGSSTFNWREVACSPECGTIYLERIIASRSTSEEPKAKKKAKTTVSKNIPVAQDAIVENTSKVSE